MLISFRGIRRFCSEAAGELLQFGKYRGLSYAKVRSEEPEYCDWVLKQAKLARSSPGPHLLRFAKWLEDQGHTLPRAEPIGSDGRAASKVGFGKYKDLTYASLLSNDPKYCEWVLRAAAEDSLPSMIALKEWLKSTPTFSQKQI